MSYSGWSTSSPSPSAWVRPDVLHAPGTGGTMPLHVSSLQRWLFAWSLAEPWKRLAISVTEAAAFQVYSASDTRAMPDSLQEAKCCAVVGYVVAAWAVDLDVANGILPGYIMGLYFFTGYALRLQVTHTTVPLCLSHPAVLTARSASCSMCSWRLESRCQPLLSGLASAAMPLTAVFQTLLRRCCCPAESAQMDWVVPLP